MGTLFFCIFCAYALSFWFGYQLLSDPDENYDVETMIAVSCNNYVLPIESYCQKNALPRPKTAMLTTIPY